MNKPTNKSKAERYKKKCQFKHFKHFNSDSSAVSNIVTSIMMLGIVMTILGMVMTIYVPMWARSNEINHLDDVADSFTDLKITIDDQILENDEGSKYTTRISLGASGGPVLGIGRSTGGLIFDSGKAAIIVYQTEDPLNIFGQGGGNLEYSSQNSYYIDQKLVYENGAFILVQNNKAVMKASPDMTSEKDTITNLTTLDMTMISLLGTHLNIGGTEDKMVETVLKSDMLEPHLFDWNSDGRAYGQNITIKFITFYPDVWVKYFNETLGQGPEPLQWDPDGTGAIYDGDYYIDTSSYSGSDPILSDATEIFVNIRNIRFMDCEQAVFAVTVK